MGFSPGAASVSAAQDSPVPAEAVTLAGAQQWILHGDVPARDYLIQAGVPDSPPPANGYPVLYVLDGNAHFPLAVASRAALTLDGPYGETVPWLIVGIGYPGVNRFAGAARSEDYTPALAPGIELDRHGRPIGGAEAFREFLERQLQPMIARRFTVDESHQALLGHSYGGLFVLDTLLEQPQMFSDYIAVSPSLWWQEGRLFDRLEHLGGMNVNDRRVLIGLGEFEAKAANHGDGGGVSTRLSDVARFADELQRHRPTWHVEDRTFPSVGHGNVMWPAMAALWPFLAPVVRYDPDSHTPPDDKKAQ
ncbi:alpha/beta hydrolase [Salinicola acroporae]|uniref:alpha/beta hydrolase n=1 Tax=Salinicola acroporae TaxID=1541440 RepID=UPI0013A62FEE|nr:alpha/beta hydrolase-fold protein [Salinicola acroporae]